MAQEEAIDWSVFAQKYINETTDALKTAVPQATEAVIQYQWAQAVTFVAIAVLLFVFSVCWFLFKKFDNDGEVIIFSKFLPTFLIGLFALMMFGENFPTVLAPEGAAIMKIVEAMAHR